MGDVWEPLDCIPESIVDFGRLLSQRTPFGSMQKGMKAVSNVV